MLFLNIKISKIIFFMYFKHFIYLKKEPWWKKYQSNTRIYQKDLGYGEEIREKKVKSKWINEFCGRMVKKGRRK
jgi:hypothetical protein